MIYELPVVKGPNHIEIKPGTPLYLGQYFPRKLALGVRQCAHVLGYYPDTQRIKFLVPGRTPDSKNLLAALAEVPLDTISIYNQKQLYILLNDEIDEIIEMQH